MANTHTHGTFLQRVTHQIFHDNMKLEQHCSDRRRKSEKDEKDEDQIIQTRLEYMAPFHG